MPAKPRKKHVTPTDNNRFLASVAAALMPKVECPTDWASMSPAELKVVLEKQRAGFMPHLPYAGQDGTSPLDVIMEEAILRARMLIAYANGVDSWTRTLAKQARQGTPASRAEEQFSEAIRKEKLPLHWRRFVELILPNSTEKMREAYWRAYRAKGLREQLEVEHGCKVHVVWQDGPKSRPAVAGAKRFTLDEKQLEVVFHRIAKAEVEAAQFRAFYEKEGGSLRKESQRKGSLKGNKKAEDRLKREEAPYAKIMATVGDGRKRRYNSQ